jgi:hypothetical protein
LPAHDGQAFLYREKLTREQRSLAALFQADYLLLGVAVAAHLAAAKEAMIHHSLHQEVEEEEQHSDADNSPNPKQEIAEMRPSPPGFVWYRCISVWRTRHLSHLSTRQTIVNPVRRIDLRGSQTRGMPGQYSAIALQLHKSKLSP